MDLKNSVGVWAFGPAVTRFVPPGYHHGGDLQAFVVEVLITFILVFVVMAVATDDRAPAAIAPIAVGFALAVGVFIAAPVTGGSVNPARSLGPMIVAGDLTSVWLYVLGPIVGGSWGPCSTTARWPSPKAWRSREARP